MEKILIVEDETNIREVLSRALAGKGFAIETASDGESARQILLAREFNVVVTDLKLPGCSGFELLDLIKEHTHDTAVIIMTAHGSVENAVEAMKRGADDYVLKPFRLDEIELKIDKILAEKNYWRKPVFCRPSRRRVSAPLSVLPRPSNPCCV